jgi:hypothetical protein
MLTPVDSLFFAKLDARTNHMEFFPDFINYVGCVLSPERAHAFAKIGSPWHLQDQADSTS